MIELNGFCKAYDDVVAVEDLTFAVNAREVVGLIGPNGAGKTSTMRALTGIIPASRGQLSICGFDIRQHPLEAKGRLAYIADDPQLFPDLTVEQHLAFTAGVYNVSNADNKASDLLEQFELVSKRHTLAGDLSRGMRQKLAICCGYLHDPDAILFDEPLTGLDPLGIRTLKESILDRANRGAAIIVSSHLLAMVEDICSHVLILDAGRKRFFGDLVHLKQSFAPKNESSSLEEIFFRATDAVHHQTQLPV